jgi:hypothetical protein
MAVTQQPRGLLLLLQLAPASCCMLLQRIKQQPQAS